MMKVYLGGSRGDWRDEFKRSIPEVECYDPFKQSEQSSLMFFTKEDLEAVANSDVVFFHINYPVYTGSCLEAGYAHALGKEIILVFSLKGRIDSLLIGISRAVFTNFDSALTWFKKDVERKLSEEVEE